MDAKQQQFVLLYPARCCPVWRRLRGSAVVLLALFVSAAVAGAATPDKAPGKQDSGQQAPAATQPVPPPTAATGAPAPAAAPSARALRGLFAEVSFAGGTMVLNQEKTRRSAQYPLLEGKSQQLGPGAGAALTVGVDLADFLAVQIFGGHLAVLGQRSDWVRDFNFLYAGGGLRLRVAAGGHWRFLLSPGAAYVQADNRVEKATQGLAAHCATGVEYDVYLRHFSVGFDLFVLAPMQPMRLFVGLAPHLRYTF